MVQRLSQITMSSGCQAWTWTNAGPGCVRDQFVEERESPSASAMSADPVDTVGVQVERLAARLRMGSHQGMASPAACSAFSSSVRSTTGETFRRDW